MIAVTGGTGFVGKAVLDEAADKGLAIRALARSPQPPREGTQWISGDLGDSAALSQLVEGAGTVMHIAGAVNAPDPAGFHRANVIGTQNVIKAAEAAGVTRFIFVSSLSAREPGLSVYGQSKLHAEEAVQTSALDWTIVRPPAVYGPNDREILELFRAARFGVVPMPPAGRTSIIHVCDLAKLLVALVPESDAVLRRVFEPDDGRERGWSHRELAQGIGTAMGRKVWAPHLPKPVLSAIARLDGMVRGDKAKLTPDRVGYMAHPDWVADPGKAPPDNLWRADIATPEGLRATAEWYRQAGWL